MSERRTHPGQYVSLPDAAEMTGVSTRTIKRLIKAGKRLRGLISRKILKPELQEGYEVYRLSVETMGAVRKVRAGVAVLEAFVGPRPSPKHEAAHEDGIRGNNRLDNLKWKTKRENEADKFRHGTALIGSRANGVKLRDFLNRQKDEVEARDPSSASNEELNELAGMEMMIERFADEMDHLEAEGGKS